MGRGGSHYVTVLEAGGNIGFAAGCNLGAAATSGETLVFLNPDTVVAPGALAALAARLEDESVGVAMARLRLLDEPELLNSTRRGAPHLRARLVERPRRARRVGRRGCSRSPTRTARPSRSAGRLFESLGRFTDELFIYLEDAELSWRARLAGLRVVLDPAADVFHDYEYARNPTKLYYMERNRLIFVLTAFQLRTILALLPVLLADRARHGRARRARRAGSATRSPAGAGRCAAAAGFARTAGRRRRFAGSPTGSSLATSRRWSTRR